ncbi:MAG TPA: glutamine synthetase family protein [Longimicrobiaceae bacterium]
MHESDSTGVSLEPDTSEAEAAAAALRGLREREVSYLRLQFSDMFGVPKSIEVPRAQFEKALAGRIMFDGSAMDGNARVEESDMLLRPDLASLRVFEAEDGTAATVVCDVHRPDGGRFEGDPRAALGRAVATLELLGLQARVGADLEFFLLRLAPDGEPSLELQDRAGYYDVAPLDRSEEVRREIVRELEAMGVEVLSALHEVAASQHRIELGPLPAMTLADTLTNLRVVVRTVARRHGLHGSFMPKPFVGANGSGLHLHHSLWRDERNVFFDAEARDELSDTLRLFVGGLLRHARAYCAITNPLVNSYKRLVPDHEAPVNVAWSLHNRSPMIRIPMERGEETRCEVRIADAAANPYLALAVQISAGLDGLRQELDPGEPINKNLWTLTPREKQRLRIAELPRHLGEALDELERDRVTRMALGEYIFSRFTEAKREEWLQYLAHVHPWEVERYL